MGELQGLGSAQETQASALWRGVVKGLTSLPLLVNTEAVPRTPPCEKHSLINLMSVTSVKSVSSRLHPERLPPDQIPGNALFFFLNHLQGFGVAAQTNLPKGHFPPQTA